jgi:hypothetical protein
MFFRLTRAPLLLAVAALLLLDPNCLADWNARPASGPESAVSGDALESPVDLAPDDEPLGDPFVPPPPPPANKPPVISGFKHTVQGNVVIFTGKVEDENPSGLTVRFGGPPSMDGQVATTDASGNFTLSVNMGGQIGEVWSRTTDALGSQSAYAYDNVY